MRDEDSKWFIQVSLKSPKNVEDWIKKTFWSCKNASRIWHFRKIYSDVDFEKRLIQKMRLFEIIKNIFGKRFYWQVEFIWANTLHWRWRCFRQKIQVHKFSWNMKSRVNIFSLFLFFLFNLSFIFYFLSSFRVFKNVLNEVLFHLSTLKRKCLMF